MKHIIKLFYNKVSLSSCQQMIIVVIGMPLVNQMNMAGGAPMLAHSAIHRVSELWISLLMTCVQEVYPMHVTFNVVGCAFLLIEGFFSYCLFHCWCCWAYAGMWYSIIARYGIFIASMFSWHMILQHHCQNIYFKTRMHCVSCNVSIRWQNTM